MNCVHLNIYYCIRACIDASTDGLKVAKSCLPDAPASNNVFVEASIATISLKFTSFEFFSPDA